MESLDSGEDGKNSNKTKMMSIGRKKFNMDPKKGIEFLIEKGLLQNTPESVAQFLHKGEGLNKTAIGDYLGEKNDFNEQVLQAFVELHDFTDLILVQALRYGRIHFISSLSCSYFWSQYIRITSELRVVISTACRG